MDPLREKLTLKHNIRNTFVFWIKTFVLSRKRNVSNLLHPTTRFSKGENLKQHPIISFSQSALWNATDGEDNWIMTAGKIQNLRIAIQRLHGLEVPANKTFSFWKQLGKPAAYKGYVVGRELREGCIVPTIAGGICQLSNALYDAAMNANFDIEERHRHTEVVPGSLAEKDRDATVKWNYIDLRFKSKHAFRIEVELTEKHLMLRFRAAESELQLASDSICKTPEPLNDCYSCGNTACYVHEVSTAGLKRKHAITTFLVDEKWPEYAQYIEQHQAAGDGYVDAKKEGSAFYRALMYRLFPKRNVFKWSLSLDRKVALQAARKIPIHCTHLVVSQNLLPALFEARHLGGRTFDVLMTRLPVQQLQDRLDEAYENYKDSPTLHDFRASQSFIDLENKALLRASKIITPHAALAQIFTNKTIQLPWILPTLSKRQQITPSKILFPASALGRKGAYEMRRFAKELGVSISVLGNATEQEDFWGEGVTTERFNGDWSAVKCVIFPTYIEHQPRQILKAMALNIPVITTSACGIAASENVNVVHVSDYNALVLTYKSLFLRP